MKRFFVMIGLICAVSCVLPTQLFAGEIDILVNKLVEKNILSPVEAQIILDETKQEVAKQVVEGKSYALPSWVQKMKLKGDLRLRYQMTKKEGSNDRHRGRYRFRLGVETKVVDKVKVGFGLATGGTDPRSTNQTMANTFETPDIRLDYAYLKYSAAPWADIYAGKFKRKNVIWQPSDLLWDGDINPEGAAVSLAKGFKNGTDLFFNAGIFILDESSSDKSDPYMFFAQPGVNIKLTDNVALKTAVGLYKFNSVKGAALDHSAGTNTLNANSKLVYDYNVFNPSVELSVKEPFGGIVPYLSIFADYVNNPDPSSQNEGYLAGVKFGDKKIKKKGNWQLKYMYRRLEKDAWLDTFPDSDFYSGKTDAKGHEIVFGYGLAKNISVGLDYYRSENIIGASKTQQVLQADLKLKF